MDILPTIKKPDKPKNGSTKPYIGKHKFLIISEFGELLDLAMWLDQTGHEVLFHVMESEYKKIGDGLVPKTDDSWTHMGEGYIYVMDGTDRAKRMDWLRSKGEYVVGSNQVMAELENDRQKAQAWFKELGFRQPKSENFTDFDSAMEYVRKSKTKLILKQNGNAPKSLNHKGIFDDGYDMLYHLEKLKKSWNESSFGSVDFDLMEIVEGQEIAASAFFNGHDWLRNDEGKVVGFLNWEQKKESDGDLGETTGEMGTIFIGADEDDPMFNEVLMRDGIAEKLAESSYHGVFDINGSITDEGYVAFEPTSRFGVPATSYVFMEGLETDCGDLLAAMAFGLDTPIEVKREFGIVQVIAAKPFPVEADMADEATSIGERLWPLNKGKRQDDFTKDQWRHIHLENFLKKDDSYLVATKNGYLLTVTQTGDSIEEARQKSLDFIKDNIYISGMKYRQDLGANIEL